MNPHRQDPTVDVLADAIYTLNQRWARQGLARWKGQVPTRSPESVYAGFDDILTRATIEAASAIDDPQTRIRLRHGLIDHYLQRLLMPHETEMQAWVRGAAAHVDGEKIYFRDIIPWCQKSSTLIKRQKLQNETGPLCKLLKPFALNYWNIVIDTLTEKLGFDGYIDYCRKKKGIDYASLYSMLKPLVAETDDFYYAAMEAWGRDRFHTSLDRLNRFDAMYLLGLGQWDDRCPPASLAQSLTALERWQIDPMRVPGLHLDIAPSSTKSAQAITIMVRIPDDIHLLIRPEGGWIDVESLWHELGHGLSAAFCDRTLTLVMRELTTGFSLSEVFAFLLQRAAISRPVLTHTIGVSESDSQTITAYRQLKDLSVFRRYAAKFICEYEMFTSGNLDDGRHYADTMQRITGFYHQPESHLFDLVPEFYCVDYLLGWMGEAQLAHDLQQRWGAEWIFVPDCGQFLKSLWHQGNLLDIFSFFEQNGLGPLTPQALQARWQRLRAAPPAGEAV